MAPNACIPAVERYGAKRELLQELRNRLMADAPTETIDACGLLLEIEEDLTRSQFVMRQNHELRRQIVGDTRKAVAHG